MSARKITLGEDEFDTTGTTGTTDDPEDVRDDAPFTQPTRERTRDLARLEEDLTQLYVNVGVIAGVVGGPGGNLAGTVVASRAPMLAGSWIDLAERDQRVRTAIKRLLQGNAWSGVAFAHIAVALPIAACTGILPEPVAQKVMMGLALQDPELYGVMSAYIQQQQAATNGNGASA